MPWLVGTALLHALIVSQKQATFLAWSILLAVTAFALSLIGTFLVRSGVLTSVHAFAVDPKRGLFILVFLIAMISWAYGLYLFKAHKLLVTKPMYWFSRESSILINNLILFVMMLVVLIGTLYPLIVDGLGFGKLSVGAPYFNTVMLPMLLIFLLFMGLAIHLHWQQDSLSRVMKKVLVPFILSIVGAYLLLKGLFGEINWLTCMIVALAMWVLASLMLSLYCQRGRPKKANYWAMWIAHSGFAFSIIGIAVSSGYGIEKDLKMQPHESVSIAQHQVRFIKEQSIMGANYHGALVEFSLDERTAIYPEKRIYNVGNMVMTDAAVDANLVRDIYIALGEPLNSQAWAVRVYYKPLIRWIWFGGVLMFLGGVCALYHYRRHWWLNA